MNIVRQLEPDILFFSDAGPGVRWVGNERGVAGETNWNTITTDTLYAGKAGIENLLQTGSPDGKQWVPAEVDVSIRPGWFYHSSEDSLVKSPARLFEIYLTSVGRGSTLLLNVPPDRRGMFHENDVASLRGFRELLDKTFKTNLARQAIAVASNTRGNSAEFAASNVTDGNKETYWASDDDVKSASITVTLHSQSPANYIVLQEYITLGQRISSFYVEAFVGGSWRKIAKGTTIGYKRILKIDPVKASRFRITIDQAKACPVISNIEIY
jgi:alpha-L-fucosidase